MSATMKDIANETGLGLATISSYFNGGNVRPGNREKIEAAIEKLHYEINETARGLKTDRTRTIGVVIPELQNMFAAKVICHMEDILLKHGYAMIVCDCRTDRKREREAVEFLKKRRVDALFNIPVDNEGGHLKSFLKTGRPVVLIDREIKGIACDTVCTDNFRAIADAVRLMAANGHRRLGMITGPQEISAARERLRGFRSACEELGIAEADCVTACGDDTIEGGARAAEEILAGEKRPTGMIISNYSMTVGAIIRLNEMGISIPEDLSVIGFDNINFAKAMNPVLTIVDQPETLIAEAAADLLLKRIEAAGDEAEGARHVVIPARMVEGRSVRKIRGEEK